MYSDLVISQSGSGYEPKRIIAAGSAVLRGVPAVLHTIVPEVSTGTVVFYDNASGTSANIVATVGGGPLTTDSRIYDAQLRNGLYYLATGTPIMTITVE